MHRRSSAMLFALCVSASLTLTAPAMAWTCPLNAGGKAAGDFMAGYDGARFFGADALGK